MIKIYIPNNNIFEREYILDIIFNEFFGLEYSVEYNSDNYKIILKNSKCLNIQDTFFNKFPNDMEYLKLENIPESIKDLDIFAACFFMLTRWEEYVNKNRDKHNRFPATESLAYKQEFLDRPIVDEYVDMLKNQLLELDSSLKFKKLKKKIYLTHDVDELYKWKSFKHLFRVFAGDILKRKNLNLAVKTVKEYILVKLKRIKDPYDTFERIMDISEKNKKVSSFYFMCSGNTKYDNRYKIDENKSLDLIKEIKQRGHNIGIHPSYNSYNNDAQFKKELYLLESITGQKITEGRQHYLRFEVPVTWQIWENNGMLIDSTCGYADKDGFRCGTGKEFSVFNILTRKKLKLKERPLIVMDGTLFDYNNYELTEAINKIDSFKKKSNTLTLLWHNSYIKNFDFYEKYIVKR